MRPISDDSAAILDAGLLDRQMPAGESRRNGGSHGALNRVAWKTSGVIVGLIVCACVFDIIHRYIGRLIGFTPVLSNNPFPGLFIFWLTYLPLLPVPLLVARKYRLDLDGRNVSLLVHLCGAALFSYVQMFLASAITEVLELGRSGPTLTARLVSGMMWNVINNFPIPFLSYWAMVISMYAFYFEDESRQREISSAQLEASLIEARLRVLQAQLSPHFFFNTLNAISALAVKGDPNSVVEMMARLGDFLRTCLDDGRPQQVPLAKEVELAQSYLEIQKLCFGDRLTIQQHIAPETVGALVPSMILQPVIENAIVHGIAEQLGVGCITIEAARDNGRLRLQVSDNGPGFESDTRHCEGIGLSMTRSRLEQFYGTDYEIYYGSAAGQMTTVTIFIPFICVDEECQVTPRA